MKKRVHMRDTGVFIRCRRRYGHSSKVEWTTLLFRVTCLECLDFMIRDKRRMANTLTRDAARMERQAKEIRIGLKR